MDNEFRIAKILKSKGMTQTDLAERIGISRVGLSKAINGNTTITTLRKIATALDVPVTELFAPQPRNTITCPKCGTVLEVKERK
ncbi:helix-turn-helix domain-containing protein [Candidatus Alistipes pullistercoris]|jgi:transcriptional regulator with XRE-family HTH domain|uniref:helix-turn-helix domain-containing protein n=1 Tax=Candidatus Alistipes pullistercoris TaxID=2838446 RepID=UPI0022E4E37B|nr:helix-turn-helix transcriptional regulator [Candidatus Alistipes pullistercoris]